MDLSVSDRSKDKPALGGEGKGKKTKQHKNAARLRFHSKNTLFSIYNFSGISNVSDDLIFPKLPSNKKALFTI